MKRSAELRGLSDDHHRALVLAKRAKQVTVQKDNNGVRDLGAEIRREWDAGLAHHFAVEEAHLLPPVCAAGGYALASRIERDHTVIQHLVLEGPFDEARLREFAERLSDHVRFEERELFPYAEAKLEQADLERIANAHRG